MDEWPDPQAGPFVFPSRERKQMRDEEWRLKRATWLRRACGVVLIALGAILGEAGVGIVLQQSVPSLLIEASVTSVLGLIIGPFLIFAGYCQHIAHRSRCGIWQTATTHAFYSTPWRYLRFLVCACPAIAAGIEFTLGEWSWLKSGCAAAGSIAAAFLLTLFNDGSAGDSLVD
jgi:hypothetical protein